MTWITTSLSKNSPIINSYEFTITGLTASSNYNYRAYFIVDGVEYYGNILSGTTAAITLTPPNTNSGDGVSQLSVDGFQIDNITISDNGGAPIIEYGVLYTQLSSWGDDVNLRYGNYPTYVNKNSTNSDVVIPSTYFSEISGLASNTMTYYRGFARNAIGIAYGSVKTQKTEPVIVLTNNIDVVVMWDNPIEYGSNDGFEGEYSLFCCNGMQLEVKSVSPYSKSSSANWVVNSGCYYVDFSGLCARVNNVGIFGDLYWKDNFNEGYSNCTSCFSGDNNVAAELPVPL